jgi:glutamate-ammonia-ligase adenylyltransferase
VVSDYLTDLAESVLGRATRLASDHLARKHGRPTNILGEQTGFAVIGFGKLGGIELGYGSDLDLVFLHGSQSAMAMTEGVEGRRQVANDVFYARLGQRLIHLLTTRTPAGILYEVDMRLRPNGNAGMLVSSLSAFEHYQHNEAWTWEHQALLRARPVAGEAAVLEAFQRIRRDVLARERDPDKLLADVTEMRARMRTALDKSDATRFDLKQGVGGIADIEFMVQYAVLRWAHQHPDLLDWTDNLRLLEGLARYDLLEGRAAELLANLYQVLRAAYHRNALQESPGVVPDGELREERAMVGDLWRSLMGAPD